MKYLINLSRLIVGVLFIFSGLVKANDPLGLSYKMQEFFEVWHFEFLNNYTLAFSLMMIVFEIVAGVAVLIGWRMRLFSWLLLLLILFFTFLTGYALFSGKIRECGCFGDCIPLQANQSFIKDLILLVLILFLFPFRNKIRTNVRPAGAALLLVATVVFSVLFQWYVLRHLPVVDCLPYKIGKNIPDQMKAPAGSIPDSTVIVFTYKKDNKDYRFTADNFPADFGDTYVFVKREDEVVRKGNAVPPIRDFSLQTVTGTDTTNALLSETGRKLFLFIKDGYKKGEWNQMIAMIQQRASSKHIPCFLVTNLEITGAPIVPGLFPLRSDGTAIKTAARYNPTLFLINQGTIEGKWSAVDLDKALNKIAALPAQ